MSVPGDTLQTYAHVLDTGGTGVPGLTVTLDLAAGPAGPLDSGRFSWTDAGSGFYAIYLETLSTDPSGQYEVHFHVDDPYSSPYVQTWTVFPAQSVFVSPAGSERGISRRELRRSVAVQLYDLMPGTSYAGGETNRIIDPVRFARETNYFKGMQIVFDQVDSPNFGHIATITRSDGPTRSLYFEPPLANPIQPGEEVELYNFRGRGSTVELYNHLINDAIRIAREQHAVLPWSETLDVPISQASTLEIPEIFTQVSGVRYGRSDGSVYFVQPRDMVVDRFSRSITLRGRGLYGGLGKLPTIVGFARPNLLNSDDDRTLIDPEWLFNEVKAQVLERQTASGMPLTSQDRLFLQERTESGGKRPIIVNRVPANTIRL